MSARPLALREAPLEWAVRSASDGLDGLEWVATEVDPDFRGIKQFDDGGQRRFRHYPYTYFLPPPVTEAAVAAQRAGQPTAWEALLLLFARTEWFMASRDYLWTPFSPAPVLLGSLVEAYGIEPAIHRRDPDSLRRLAAMLPSWHPYRGTVQRARDVLAACGLDDELDAAATLENDGPLPKRPSLDDEVFTCHVARWWRLRGQEGSVPEYRISGGFLRFQPADDDRKWLLRREDLLLAWRPGGAVPKAALRLLPSWSVVRLAIGPAKRAASSRTAKAKTSKTPKAKKTS